MLTPNDLLFINLKAIKIVTIQLLLKNIAFSRISTLL